MKKGTKHIMSDDTIESLKAHTTALQDELQALKQRLTEVEHERDQALSEKQWMHSVLMQAPSAIFLLRGPNHIYEMANPAYLRMVNKSDVIGKPVRDVFPELEGQGYFETLDHVYASGEPFIQSEFPAQIDRQGTGTLEQGWFNVVYQPLRNTEGAVEGILHLVTEVTDQVLARQDLERLNTEYQLMTTHATDMISRHAPDGAYRYASLSCYALLGYTPEELAGTQSFDYMHPDDIPAVQESLATILEKPATFLVTYRLRRKNGTYVWVETTSRVIRDPETQEISEIIAVTRDITARKQAEKETRVFKALIDNSPQSIGIANLDGSMTYANEAFGTMSGYGDALVGMSFMQCYPEEDLPAVQIAAQKAVQHGIWQGQLRFKRKDGTLLPVQLLSFLIYDSDGNPVALSGMFQDLTQQQQAEQERLALQQQIIDSQRSFIRELSTPLIPLSHNVVLMPLIGTIDSSRSQMIIEVLLEGVASYQANTAIVDITGVSVVDTQVANAIIQAAQAVKLLGAQVILTGIGPAMAQTLVHLGADLSSIQTRGSLQRAIVDALLNG